MKHMKGAGQMTKLLENGVKLIIAFVIIIIILSILGHLISLAVRLAILAAVVGGIYLGAKKIGLIKGK
jgi:hypothetical protein